VLNCCKKSSKPSAWPNAALGWVNCLATKMASVAVAISRVAALAGARGSRDHGACYHTGYKSSYAMLSTTS